MSKVSVEDVMELSVSERIQLVEDIWDTIALKTHALPLTSAQCAELDRRLEDNQLHPEDGVPWEEVKRKILSER